MRHLLYHPESEARFVAFRRAEIDQALDAGCDIVTGNELHERIYMKEKAMQKKLPITVSATFTRDMLANNRNNPQGNEVIGAAIILKKLRDLGVPVIGVLGVIAVEWGELRITAEDGLDGDEWTYSWAGMPMTKEWQQRCAQPGKALKLDTPLAALIAADDEL